MEPALEKASHILDYPFLPMKKDDITNQPVEIPKPKDVARDIAEGMAPGDLVLEVTVKRVYFIPEGYNQLRSVDHLVKDWFGPDRVNRYHAAREASRVGNSDQVTEVRTLEKKAKA